jgi:DNA-binding transcriptional ArsR family regulator
VRQAVFAALVDPTRRAIYERLRRREYTVGELTELAGVSQPAVSQHLRELRRAKLVTDRKDGRRRYYQAGREGLAELRQYVEQLWDDVLVAFAADDPGRQQQPGRRKRS